MAEEVVEEKPKSGGKGLMIVLIALIVVLLLAVIGGGYFLYSQGVFNPQEEKAMQELGKKEVNNSKEMYKAAINDLVLNITNAKGREKLMKLSFTIKSNDPAIESIVESYKAEIVDVVISQISARSSEELLTVGGKALLKDELVDEINKVLNEATATNSDIQKNSVKEVLFTTFVIK
ncbi:flagellar basal body-associated protein FliL [Arcobacter nitrofigilis DSM 7299]|uniref:Flagellar protein FliL n=1 Tax=Arcobacter nitrofigilis (strain ATCC 33309 / DSM 7299 / CCUG 15893 / LMG 7604 / NCTC 12251 / CI) TaxID=572480 RepID=D5V7A4_ARCNC|nr:flagellar basal body-associated FliL family protein [Arcobacter nitrofigilis]ADG94524.1 flagellar basal body-associated protein FliL [Arcobacter nitrofigilis DSM 7299]